MPWRYPGNVPSVAENWTAAEQRRCVAAANAVLSEGGEDAESNAIYACIHAAGRSKKEEASAEEDKTVTEQKTVPFELTKVDTAGRTFEGYASVFRSPDADKADHTGDMVIAGAFKKSLAERGGKVRMLWQHDPSQPIGKFTELREDARGLYVKGVVSDTRLGRDCLALLKDKAIDSMSIGYDALPGGTEYVKGTDGKSVRLLKEIRLWEVSLVTFPADEQATVTQVKKQGAEADSKALEEARKRVESALDEALDEALTASCTARLLGDAVKASAGPSESKSGRRLSAASRGKIEAAMAALKELMGDLDMPHADDDEEDDTQHPMKADNPPAASAQSDSGEPEAQAGEDTQESERKAGPGTTPPTSEASATEEAGPDVTPPTSSEAKSQGPGSGEPEDDDPFAEFDREMARVASLLTKGVA